MTEIEACGLSHLPILKGYHLEAAATKVGHKAGRIGDVQRQAAGDVMRFFFLA